MQEASEDRLWSVWRRFSYSLITFSGMKMTCFLLLGSNENQMKNMQKCKLFFLGQLDLCTKASCCEAAEIFNTIY